MFSINEIKKRHAGIDFEQTLDVKEELMARNPEILDVGPVTAKGNISFENGLYLLTYHLTYQLTLTSSRSMAPVEYTDHYVVTEAFIEQAEMADKQDLVDEDLVLTFEGSHINLKDSVIDNILLNIPLRVLTPEEENDNTLPSGDSWTVLTQEQYLEKQAEKKKENNPFSALSDLFNEFDQK